MKTLLVVVDYQNDFVNGALGAGGADALEPGILAAVKRTLAHGGYVLFTRDTHGRDYLDTREGRFLPVPHCVAGSRGHRLYGRLAVYEQARTARTALLDKATFGAPDIGRAAKALCEGAPDTVELCGLVTDICVTANALLLHSAFPAAQVAVRSGLCGSGNPEGAAKALDVLRGMGVEIIE